MIALGIGDKRDSDRSLGRVQLLTRDDLVELVVGGRSVARLVVIEPRLDGESTALRKLASVSGEMKGEGFSVPGDVVE